MTTQHIRIATRFFVTALLALIAGATASGVAAEPPRPTSPVDAPSVDSTQQPEADATTPKGADSAGVSGDARQARITGENERLSVDDLMKGRRRFEPGAHTAWHIHPGGQLILVEKGVGVVQQSGQPLKILHAGDSYFTPPGIPHWHGALPDTAAVMAMIHFGGIGPWLGNVTQQQYLDRIHSPQTPQEIPAQDRRSSAGDKGQNYAGESTSPPSDDIKFARGHFKAGARTYWHIHPMGQLILVERGHLRLQKRGESVKVLGPGESDFTPPGVAHWHGASVDEDCVMVVANFDNGTLWLEPVSDSEYRGGY